MRGLLAPLRSADRGIDRRPENAETQERLRSLGYVAAGPAPAESAYTEDDDPKRLIALDALLEDTSDLYFSGDLPGAVARCRELVRQRPQMPLSWLYLAHLQREAGDLAAAVRVAAAGSRPQPRRCHHASLLGCVPHAGRAAGRGPGRARAPRAETLSPTSRC